MSQKPDFEDGLPELVDLTYSATTDPGRYDQLVGVWERYMANLSPGEIEDTQRLHLRHFNQALEIFERIGRQRHRQEREDAVLQLFDGPAYLVDRNGAVVMSNTDDRALPREATRAASDTLIDRATLKAAVADLQHGAPVALIPIHDAEDRLTDCAVISALGADSDRFLMVLSASNTPQAQMDQLALKFDLSPSEQDVFAALLRGEKVGDISDARGVGLATTRTQVRKLLEKTGSATLADLIRQTTQINAQVSAVTAVQKMQVRGDAEAIEYDRILTSDGRLLAYRSFGDPQGRPVLLIHNMMGGPIWPAGMVRQAAAEGWRIIAPSRPGFGLSDSYAARDMKLVQRTCSDMRALLDHLGIDRVLVLSMMSSAGLGIRFARDHADRVQAMLNVGHAGLMDDQLINAMANPSRAMAKTYRKSPTALRFLIRVAVASDDMLGPAQMLRSNFRRSRPDMVLLEDVALIEALGEGLRHAIAQGGEAFSRDGFVALNDFSADIAHISCPAVCLLGDEDPMYPAEQAERLMAEMPGYALKVFEDAGQFVFYGEFLKALGLMDELWAQGAKMHQLTRPA
jgi:pimeloyl-ACP methyl ester carboxylesterase/DNA-binding NarL/FixJ family response regulator